MTNATAPKLPVIFLFLLNFVTALALINEGLFHYDSVVLAQAVEKTYRTGILQPAFAGRYGSVILNFIAAFPFLVTGANADFAVRLCSVFFHAASIVMFFLLVKELFSDTMMAFFSALLLSFTPFYFSPNTYGKEHGAANFFLFLSLFLLKKGLDKRSAVYVSIASAAFVYAITVRESMLVATPLFLLFWFYPAVFPARSAAVFFYEKVRSKLFLSFAASFFAAFFFIYFSYLRGAIKEILTAPTTTPAFLGMFSPALAAALRDLYANVPFLVFIFAAVGAFRMILQRKFFLSGFFLLWCASLFYYGNISLYCPRYLDMVVIPVYVFAGYALSGLLVKDKLIAYSIVIYCMVEMFGFLYPVLAYRHRYNGEKQLALFVKEKTEKDAIIYGVDHDPFIQYYGGCKTVEDGVYHINNSREFIARIKSYLQRGIPFYILEKSMGYPSNRIHKKALEENLKLTLIGEKLTEDYHKVEARLALFNERLVRVSLP